MIVHATDYPNRCIRPPVSCEGKIARRSFGTTAIRMRTMTGRPSQGEGFIWEARGRRYLAEWVEAVNSHGGFGRWPWAVTRQPGDIRDILAATTPVTMRGS